MDLQKKQYLESCRKFFQEFSSKNKVLIKYYTKKRWVWSQPILSNPEEKRGVVVVFNKDGQLFVGYSLCHVSLGDKFDKYVGLSKAIQNARPISTLSVRSNIEALLEAKKKAFAGKATEAAKKLTTMSRVMEAELAIAIKHSPVFKNEASGKETREFPHSMANTIAKALSYANSYFRV